MVRCSYLLGVGRLQLETIRLGIEQRFERKRNESTEERDSADSAAQNRGCTLGRVSAKS